MEFSATSWKDNKQVLLIYTYVCAEPADTIIRYDKKLRLNVQVSCLWIIKEYNSYLGDVDLIDSFLCRYRIRIKSKKWTTRLFYHLLDMTMINAWELYKNVSIMKGKTQQDIMKLADFRTKLADTLYQFQSRSKNKRGRPDNNSRREENPEPSKRLRPGVQVLP
ncbi:piggyBac transposable element-derived protein 4 [Nephila pilipes]|uniref:PiggyBac transposable element-derived protein 4 n=1 Tax=Nephila pilipes TaxID=299642 RepID=A0A8X6QRR6_NEPPI|nr:piggyBac transposable element-derived protein 4 [Nephila pilipes]